MNKDKVNAEETCAIPTTERAAETADSDVESAMEQRDADLVRGQEIQDRIVIALCDIERIHRPIDGEARTDPNAYCSTCVGPGGRSRVYPCRTVRIVRELLESAKAALATGESTQ